MTGLQFQYPVLLHSLWVLPLLILLAWFYRRWLFNARQRFGKLPRQRGVSVSIIALLTLVAILCVLMTNPRIMGGQKAVTQRGCDILVAIDLSNSMLATDIKPNRLTIAKRFVQKLIQQAEGNRIGIIVFAGEAYLQMPMATDYTQAADIVQQLNVDMISAQGTVIPAAIELARRSFEPVKPGEAAGRALIMITDGENHDADIEAAAESAFQEDGILVFGVGAGTPEGASIPVAPGRFKQDENGETVLSRLNEENLTALARGGGVSTVYNISQGDQAISSIVAQIRSIPQKNLLVYATDEMKPLFQWALLPAILVLLGLLLFRNRP